MSWWRMRDSESDNESDPVVIGRDFRRDARRGLNWASNNGENAGIFVGGTGRISRRYILGAQAHSQPFMRGLCFIPVTDAMKMAFRTGEWRGGSSGIKPKPLTIVRAGANNAPGE